MWIHSNSIYRKANENGVGNLDPFLSWTLGTSIGWNVSFHAVDLMNIACHTNSLKPSRIQMNHASNDKYNGVHISVCTHTVK